MSNYIYRLFSSLTGAYRELNPATLSGAIDVIVIQQKDGSYSSSPFHVRFGKSGILRPKEKMVDLYVNDKLIPDIHMKLGEAGEAFFVEEIEEDAEEFPERLATSPIPSTSNLADSFFEKTSPTSMSPDLQKRSRHDSEEYFIPVSSSTEFNNFAQNDFNKEGKTEQEQVMFSIETDDSSDEESSNPPQRKSKFLPLQVAPLDDIAQGTLSDGEHHRHRQSVLACTSDTELETPEGTTEHPLTQTMQWEWGDLPQAKPSSKNRRKPGNSPTTESTSAENNEHSNQDGSKPDDLYLSQLDSGTDLAKYVYRSDFDGPMSGISSPTDAGYRSEPENGNINSGFGEHPMNLSMSLCGGLVDSGHHQITNERFINHLITFEEFMQNADGLLENPDLVIRLNGRYYNWKLCAPIIVSYLAFHTPLPTSTINDLSAKYMPLIHKKKRTSVRNWLFWGSRAPTQSSNEPVAENSSEKKHDVVVTSDNLLQTSESDAAVNTLEYTVRTKKTTRLSSEQISKLGLVDGANEITYSVTTQYQGTCRCTCYIYLWKWSDRLVISDIDGTITRSDVLGQVLPMVGKDWTQEGVAKLYSKIQANGYKLIYLSARAIGQAGLTRRLIERIQQEGSNLPDAPILLSPISLIHAFANEVILKKPEEFKISCLNDVKALFPKSVLNPFHSGYGNKQSDVITYRAVGIPDSRIFTVNHKGELRNEIMQTFPSSYSYQTEIVDHFYPPVNSPRLRRRHNSTPRMEYAANYSNFTFWKTPLPEVSIDLTIMK